MNAAERLARHALETRFAALPCAAVAAAKTFILDTIGVGVAGACAPYADDVLRAAGAWGVAGAEGGARLLGRDARLPPASAAFVNGFQIHCQEFDCVHEGAVVHPMATIFAALLAECDRLGGVRGEELIAAVVVAVDAAAGLGIASRAPIRFFRPANAGLFGATLGAARLRGLSLERTMNALGHALAQCSGTMQAHVEGKPSLPIQIGNAARAAIVACDLAEADIPGPHDVIDGPFGYLPLFEGDFDVGPILGALGAAWRICEVSHKPFPTGRAAQGGVFAMLRLHAQGVRAEDLSEIRLTAPPLIKRLVGRPYAPDMSVNYARLCFAYCGAVALLRGEVGLSDFSRERLDDLAIARLATRICVVDDGGADPAAFTPQRLEARRYNGERIDIIVDSLPGSPAAPLERAAHLEKFRRCMAFGFADEAAPRADALIAFVDHLESQDDCSALSRLASGAERKSNA